MIRTRGASGNDPEECFHADHLRHSPVSGFPVTKLKCEKESSKSFIMHYPGGTCSSSRTRSGTRYMNIGNIAHL